MLLFTIHFAPPSVTFAVPDVLPDLASDVPADPPKRVPGQPRPQNVIFLITPHKEIGLFGTTGFFWKFDPPKSEAPDEAR